MGNHWQRQHGAARRLIDRQLLAECEAAIALEEAGGAPTAKNQTPPSAASAEAPAALSFLDEERQRIARAFGRPIK
jgi:hypothetical protein